MGSKHGRLVQRSGATALATIAALVLGAGTGQADPAAVAALSPAGAVSVAGPSSGSNQPVPPPAGLVATAVSALDSYNSPAYLAIRPDRTVVGWGGYPGSAVPPDLTDVAAVDLGAGVGVALRTNGSVVTWSSDPTLAVPADLGPVAAISAGGRRGVSGSSCGFVVAALRDGTVRGWGEKATGTGCGDFSAPTRPPAGLRHVVAVATGSQHALALRSNGTVVGWGDGPGATPPADLDSVVQVAAGGDLSLALRSDGTVVQWGTDLEGPVPAGLRGVVALQASDGLAVALRADGSTVAWGRQAGAIASLPGGPGISSIAAGWGQVAAITVPVAVGSPRVGPSPDTNPAGRAEAFRSVASSSGTSTTRLSVYLDRTSTATRVQVGLYADASGAPGRLLASGTVRTPVAGSWNTVSVPAASVRAGQAYWLAVLAPVRAGTVRFRDLADGRGGATQTSAAGNLTTLPATWRTGQQFANAPASLYAAS